MRKCDGIGSDLAGTMIQSRLSDQKTRQLSVIALYNARLVQNNFAKSSKSAYSPFNYEVMCLFFVLFFFSFLQIVSITACVLAPICSHLKPLRVCVITAADLAGVGYTANNVCDNEHSDKAIEHS